MLAPPLSTASISAKLHGVRWNLFGSSFLSENSPFPGLIGPNSLALRPPIAPYGCCPDAAICGALDEDCLWPPFNGPCCVACSRYDAKDSGSAEDGDSGWTLGAWSISAEGTKSAGVNKDYSWEQRTLWCSSLAEETNHRLSVKETASGLHRSDWKR